MKSYSASWSISGYSIGFHYESSICFLTDMQKFPVRMKDNDLLVTQLFEDPLKEAITALSVYVTPNSCKRKGVVCVVMKVF